MAQGPDERGVARRSVQIATGEVEIWRDERGETLVAFDPLPFQGSVKRPPGTYGADDGVPQTSGELDHDIVMQWVWRQPWASDR